jgi:hypothetical protein
LAARNACGKARHSDSGQKIDENPGARYPLTGTGNSAGFQSFCMKKLHRADLYNFSRFDESRNIDFHGLLWVRQGGNVAVDPLPLSPHDERHLAELGGAALVIVTNSDHVRDVVRFAEKSSFPVACSGWLGDGDEPVAGLRVFELSGSKTPGELALLITGTGAPTLVTGDLIRAHQGGSLNLLPDSKLSDRSQALASLRRLCELTEIEAVLPGDGWPVFRDGARALRELAQAAGA